MEQHPVPRNISSFQFRLIGDMTLKQFFYMAGGAVAGFLILKFFPLPPLVKWPMAAIPTFGGLAFAFLPIQERPLDKWLVAFIRSINSPTQYLWHKDSNIPDILLRSVSTTVRALPQSHQAAHEEAKRKLESYLATLPSAPHQTINNREKNYLDKTMQLFSTTGGSAAYAPIVQPSVLPGIVLPQVASINRFPVNTTNRPVKIDSGVPVVPNIKTVPIGRFSEEKVKTEVVKPQPVQPLQQASKPATIINQQVVNKPAVQTTAPAKTEDKIKSEIPAITSQTRTDVKAKTEEVKKEDESKMKNIIAEKEKLEEELKKLKVELSNSKNPPESILNKPDVIKPQPAIEKKEPTIKTITPKTALNEIGIPKFPQVPNLIMGIIKDMQNKQLPNIILTIKDTKGIPQRALKTNRLGQFSTATPLSNGTYHIEAEDPLKRYVFDIAEINLTGKVFLPIEIDAKGEKELMREKLTKEIFGAQI